MSKFDIWVLGRNRGSIWAFDEFDARQRFASRHNIPVMIVSAYEYEFCH